FSGFPKSHNVSKAFDRRAGAEREVVGRKRHARDGDVSHTKWVSTDYTREDSYTNAKVADFETVPATELARKWDGWGTALKPAHEPIIVVRKPLIDADTGRKLTVSDCVEKYGT